MLNLRLTYSNWHCI